MKTILLATVAIAASIGFVHSASAQGTPKEAIGMFYELQMAPKICNWTNAGSTAKLDSTIAEQEKALAITPADKADFTAKAAADLKSDPTNCAPDGMVRAMYDEAVK
jgi:hypothetical protein